jgi:anti-sigma B factor antagonist
MSDSILDDATPARDDDSAVKKGFRDPGVLQVYQTGPLTVVGFAGKDVPDEVCIAGYRDQMNKLIEEHGVKVMAIDLSGVNLVPSGMLGLMLSIRKRVDRVELYNPSEDVRDVLKITNLEQMFDIKSVQV